jgi:hypothetical protein
MNKFKKYKAVQNSAPWSFGEYHVLSDEGQGNFDGTVTIIAACDKKEAEIIAKALNKAKVSIK